MRSAVLVLVIVIARGVAAQPAAPIVDHRPAAPDAVTAGAAAVEEGTALGEQNKYELALGKFLAVASDHPSATHDCYVALAYLRIGRLTLARLWFDAADRRGDARPEWCVKSVGPELASALATRGFVEVAIRVEPAAAELWIGDAHVRDARGIWLPPGDVEVRAEQPGYEPIRRTATAAAGVPIELTLVREPRHTQPPSPRGHVDAYLTLVGSGAAIATAVVFHVLAVHARDAANLELATSTRFGELDDRFVRDRAIALGGYALGAAGIAVGVWLYLRGGDPAEPRATGLGLAVELDAAMVTWSWTR